MAWGFHYDDVEPEVVRQDLDGFPTRHGNLPPWGSATVPLTIGTTAGTSVVTQIRFERNPDRIWRIRSF